MEAKDILLLVAGAVIGLVVNYFTQFTSVPLANKYQRWREKQAQKKAIHSIENAKKRIAKIEKEVAVIKWLTENPISFNAFAFDIIHKLIRNLSIVIVLGIGSLLVTDIIAQIFFYPQ